MEWLQSSPFQSTGRATCAIEKCSTSVSAGWNEHAAGAGVVMVMAWMLEVTAGVMPRRANAIRTPFHAEPWNAVTLNANTYACCTSFCSCCFGGNEGEDVQLPLSVHDGQKTIAQVPPILGDLSYDWSIACATSLPKKPPQRIR